MRSRSLLIPILSLLSVFSADAQSPTNVEGGPDVIPAAPPKPGKYVGVVTIEKDLNFEGLTTKVTLRAHAKVDAAGNVTIATVVPESPAAAAADPQSHVSRAHRQMNGVYLVDGKHHAIATIQGESFQLSFTSLPSYIITAPAPGPGVIAPPALDSEITLIIGNPVVPPATTRIHYRFYPQRQPAARRSR